MINQLFRTRFESNITPFIVFLALNSLLCFIVLQTYDESRLRPDTAEMFTAVTLWLLIFCLVAGGLSLLRYNRERHCRLFAQLPVTNLQIRLSFWCHACLYVLVSTCVLVLIMFYADIEPLTGILRFAALYFFHAGVLLSTITIASSSSMRLIPEEVRSRTILYFFLAVALTFMFLFAIGFVVAGYLHVVESDSVNWSMLTLLMLLLCAALVSLDIHLFRGKDTYLG